MRARTLSAVLFFVTPAWAAELDTRVVDGLGRPVAGVDIVVTYFDESDKRDIATKEVFRGKTDSEGHVLVVYDESALPAGKRLSAELAKPGYAGYSSSQLEGEYVLRKEATQDFADIAASDPSLRAEALRELLASDREDDLPYEQDLFFNEAELRAPLRTLVADERVGRAAIQLLADVAVREDLEYVLAHAPKIVDEDGEGYAFGDNRWAYAVATSLVNPTSDAAWAFLEACASGEYFDRWVDAGAIKTLALSDPKRATAALARAATHNVDRRQWIETLIAGKNAASPAALSEANLTTAADALAPALGVGRYTGAGEPTFNRAGDKARISMSFRNERDLLVYTAIYHRAGDGRWHLRGVRETMQALLPHGD